MKLGYFGGTFDPIHMGHVRLLRMAKETLDLDRVLVMPAGHPYHKTHDVTLMTYRYAMTKLALEGEDAIDLSTIEMLRRGPSYTLETVQEIRSGLTDEDEIYLICGLDVVLQIHLWYEAKQLLQIMKIAGFVRPGVDLREARARAEILRRDFGASIELYEIDALDISSTEIRQALVSGRRDEGLMLPPAVRDFISLHRLYEKESVMKALRTETIHRLAEIETILFERLSLKRLIHSLDTMYYAVSLALRFDVDPDRAALAALSHDIGRETDAQELWEKSVDVPEHWNGSVAFLHAPAAVTMIREQLGIDDPEILEAVRLHTTLDADASDLAKVLFVADKAEPSRQFSDLGPIRQYATEDLDRATLACLEAVEAFNRRMDYVPEAASLRALSDLRKRVARSEDKL